jgi:hypothetical protein
LTNSREKTAASPLSGVQLTVQGAPDVGFGEVTAKPDIPKANGRKKRTLDRKTLDRKKVRERTVCEKKDEEYLREWAGCIRLYRNVCYVVG